MDNSAVSGINPRLEVLPEKSHVNLMWFDGQNACIWIPLQQKIERT